MYYYHASNKLFDKFDTTKSTSFPCIHLSSDFKYAKNFASYFEGDKYVYVVKIKNEKENENSIKKTFMQNIMISGINVNEILEIIEIIKL